MITLEKLQAFGADTAAGLGRCMNNEAFYLRLVNMELNDPNFAALKDALASGNAAAAFEAAHALKGALGNLSLTPVYEPVAARTEKLRGADSLEGIGDLGEQVLQKVEALKALAE